MGIASLQFAHMTLTNNSTTGFLLSNTPASGLGSRTTGDVAPVKNITRYKKPLRQILTRLRSPIGPLRERTINWTADVVAESIFSCIIQTSNSAARAGNLDSSTSRL